jgi:hypothetical protein
LEHPRASPTVLNTLRAGGSPLISPAKVARLLRPLTDEVTAVPNDRELATAQGSSHREEWRRTVESALNTIRQARALNR